MWPWEHAAVGYLVYSLALRALRRDPPSDRDVLPVLFGTQLPDLIDKPLSWGFGVFQTGYALGHSIFLAIPLGALAISVGIRTDRRRPAVAFTIGYWSHLLTDVLDPLRHGAPPSLDRVLWPLVTGTPYEVDLGLGRGVAYLRDFFIAAQSMDTLTLVVFYLLLPTGVVLLWLYDGAPGLRPIWRRLGSVRRIWR